MSRRAQLNFHTLGSDIQTLNLVMSDSEREVDFEAIFGVRERTTLFMPECIEVDSCLFWVDNGIDRVVRVYTRNEAGIAVVGSLLGQDATHLGHVLDCVTTQESNDFADCISITGGLHITGKEFETAFTLGNIAEKLRVAHNLNEFSVQPVPVT